MEVIGKVVFAHQLGILIFLFFQANRVNNMVMKMAGIIQMFSHIREKVKKGT